MGRGRGGKYNIEKRDLEAVRVLAFIADFPWSDATEISHRSGIGIPRVRTLCKYLQEYCEIIQVRYDPHIKRRIKQFALRIPLTGKAENFVRQSAILTTIIRNAKEIKG